jgi:hypothetical protein
VWFDYLANLRKFKKKNFFEGRKGLLINEKPNQGVRERKKLGYTGLDHVESPTSPNRIGLHGLLQCSSFVRPIAENKSILVETRCDNWAR